MAKPKLLAIDEDALTIWTTVRHEGSKGDGMRISIPHHAQKELLARGWDMKWLELQLPAGSPFLVAARPHPTMCTVSLPKWARGAIAINEDVTIIVRDPRPQRARSERLIVNGTIDWCAAITDDDVFPIEEKDTLVIHNRYEPPFRMRRLVSEESIMWLLGFHLAEGTKATDHGDWNLANRNVESLAHVIAQLSNLGISRDRLYLEVLHVPGAEGRSLAMSAFATLGVDVSTIRARTRQGDNEAAVIHVRSSLWLKRMFKTAFEHLAASRFEDVTETGAREFALGFLEGDGQVTFVDDRSIHLRFVGATPEQSTITLHALNLGFAWQLEQKSFAKNASGNGDEQRWAIDALKVAQLVEARAFERVSSWQRLLAGLHRQTIGFRALWAACHKKKTFSFREAMVGSGVGTVNAMRLHGYIAGDSDTLSFTHKGLQLAAALARLDQQKASPPSGDEA